MRRRMLNRAPGVAAMLFAGSLAAIALATPARPDDPGLALRAGARGALRLENSARGEPILVSRRMTPGDVVRGTVRIANAAERKARGWLAGRLTYDQGPLGGRLSRRLLLRVRSLPAGAGRAGSRLLFSGHLSDLHQLRVGRWRPGNAYRYRLVVSFPNGGRPSSTAGGDNRFQGAQVSVRMVWGAT